jgi:hypothetical protein
MTKGVKSGEGTEVNKSKIGGITTLYGDPTIKIEKPYTILLFPGGSIELSRCEDGTYWLHAATHQDLPSDPMAQITEARIDASGRYCDGGNAALQAELDKGGVYHIAFRFSPISHKKDTP